MLERVGDIFQQSDADAICFTSNGIVKQNGQLVMGAGIAKAFANRWPILPMAFGNRVKVLGNNLWTMQVSLDPTMQKHVWVCSFPTKHDWRNPSDLALIQRSAQQLADVATDKKWKRVYLTRPGTGNGGLAWPDVRLVIAPILDDRFVVLVPPDRNL